MYKSFAPPLGILYIAAVLLEHDHVVEVIDCDQEDNYLESICHYISTHNPHYVGISCVSSTFLNAVQIAKFVKSINTKSKTVVGGIHVTSFPERILREYPEIDYVIAGEGEYAFLDLVTNQDPGSVKGVSYRSAEKIVVTPPGSLLPDLDTLPFPARDLVKKYSYSYAASMPKSDLRRYLFARSRQFASIITSRGCPFRCRFCANSAFHGGIIRYRSPENVIQEVRDLIGRGYTKFFIMDDHFTSKPARTLEICKELRVMRERDNIRWLCLGRVDTASEDLFSAMAEAGCAQMLLGIESGSQKVLDYFSKKTNQSKIRHAVQCAKKFDIDIVASIIIGAPCEDDDAVRETSRFLNSLDIDFLEVNKLAVLPGTELWDDMERAGRIAQDGWQKVIFINEVDPAITTREIRKRAAYIKRRFYLRFSYGARQSYRFVRRAVKFLADKRHRLRQ